MKTKNVEISIEKNNKFNRQILFVIFIFTLLLYSNSIKNNYALDDNYVTVTNPKQPNNPRIEKGIKGIPQIFKTHYVESATQSFEYRPIPLATFAIEYQFFGSNPHVSHFISILLYALTCMLLFTVLTKLFKNYNLVFPLLITFLFIIHPIHTEVVDNIKCRDELLSFLFGLCAVYFFIESMEVEEKKLKQSALTVLFLILGLLCKQTIILFVILIPIIAYFFYDLKLKNFLYIAGSLFVVFITYKLFKRSMVHELETIREFVFFENPLYYEHGFLNRIPFALYTLGYYLKLLIFPYPLSCYYGYNTIPLSDWASPFIYVAIIFFMVIGIYALIKLPKKNMLAFAIIVFLLGILPFANLIKPAVGIVAERFVYFASFGFCIMAAHALLRTFKIDVTNKSKFKLQGTKFLTCCIGVLFVFSVLVVSRNTKWKDELTLLRNDADNFENSCNLHYLIGSTLSPEIFKMQGGIKRQEMIKEATFHYQQAIELMKEGVKEYPTDFTTLNNIGTIYMNVYNDPVSAFTYFKKALQVKSSDMMTRYNFAFCYEKRNMPDSAIYFYEKMIKSDAKYPPVYIQLHGLYIDKKEYLQAINTDKKAISLNPAAANLRVNLGNSYMLNKDTLNAVIQFKKAIEIEPKNYPLQNQVEFFLKSISPSYK